MSSHASPAVTRRCKKLSLAASNSCELSSRIDFSDIEKHSLILSDSIEVSGVGWRNKSTVTTSTPHLAPCSTTHRRVAVSPSVDSDRYSTSALSLCRSELEQLHVSDVSNITRTSSVGSYHDDSAMSRLHCLMEGIKLISSSHINNSTNWITFYVGDMKIYSVPHLYPFQFKKIITKIHFIMC